jgi:hypothetical protein
LIGFRKSLKYQVSSKSTYWEQSCSMRTDRWTDMTKLIVALRSFANASKNSRYLEAEYLWLCWQKSSTGASIMQRHNTDHGVNVCKLVCPWNTCLDYKGRNYENNFANVQLLFSYFCVLYPKWLLYSTKNKSRYFYGQLVLCICSESIKCIHAQFLHCHFSIMLPMAPWTSKWSSVFRLAKRNVLHDYRHCSWWTLSYSPQEFNGARPEDDTQIMKDQKPGSQSIEGQCNDLHQEIQNWTYWAM